MKVRPHRCTNNHSGSARLMESASGVSGVKELNESGTPVEILERDGDNTMISRLKSELGINMKKRLDKNHVVKNIGKQLYCLYNEKRVKISEKVINHLKKCLTLIFTKSQGNKRDLEDNINLRH